MDPETKKLLEETHALARDNHQMLRAIRRDHWIGVITKVVIWAVLLLLPLYLYQQYLQPIAAKFSATPGLAPAGIFGLPSSAELQKLLNSVQVKQ